MPYKETFAELIFTKFVQQTRNLQNLVLGKISIIEVLPNMEIKKRRKYYIYHLLHLGRIFFFDY